MGTSRARSGTVSTSSSASTGRTGSSTVSTSRRAGSASSGGVASLELALAHALGVVGGLANCIVSAYSCLRGREA